MWLRLSQRPAEFHHVCQFASRRFLSSVTHKSDNITRHATPKHPTRTPSVSPAGRLDRKSKSSISQTRPSSSRQTPGLASKLPDDQSSATIKPHHPRSPSGSSLRRVAVEAERSLGGYLRQRGDHQFVDPNVVTKKLVGFCAAERYNIVQVCRLVREAGFTVDPFQTGLYPQVVHFQTTSSTTVPSSPAGNTAHGNTKTSQDSKSRPSQAGDVFVFPSGTVVAWNVPPTLTSHLVGSILAPAAEHPQSVEQDSLDYLEDPTKESSSVVGDTIVLGTQPHESSSSVPPSTNMSPAAPSTTTTSRLSRPGHPVDTILTKIAFSSGLARSTKLQVLETLLDKYFESTRSIPSVLSRGQRLPFGRRSILRKTGELLHIRAQLNLYSELTDSLPDLFWDSRHSLGLEHYFDNLGRALDVGVRIKVLNQRMDYAQEMATVLREQLSEAHGLRLEWGIIFLILVEVLFECRALWKEYRVTDKSCSLNAVDPPSC